ncbi:MAG: thiosulfate oxidation carrier complex protein SoxZ [Hyphomicrobiales bacterium]
MDDVKPRVKVPATAAKGETITIKTLISHPMESGRRKGADGNIIPRQIITTFTCEFNGKPVLSIDMSTGFSKDPFFEFSARVEESGTFKFSWLDDDGSTYTAEKEITVN